MDWEKIGKDYNTELDQPNYKGFAPTWVILLIMAVLMVGATFFAVWVNGFEKTKATVWGDPVETCETYSPILELLKENPGSKIEWNNPGLFQDLECLIETPKGQRFYTGYPY